MSSFVLVPGACHGGWWYRPVVDALVAEGHTAHAVTLSGLDPDTAPPTTPVNLDTHVAEIVSVVERAAVPVVLVGHSYGGSVITGVADRLPDRVGALVYLDAFVPADGDSCYSMTNDEQRAWYVAGAGETGLAVAPLPFFDERARPHPLGTLLQRSRLTGEWRRVATKHYVAALDWPDGSPFATTTERVAADPEFTVHEWPTRHNVLADGPDRLLGLLRQL